MLIGILSDSHDNIKNLRKALQIFQQQKVLAIIHCGDICAAFMVDELAKAQAPVHIIFGNIENRLSISQKCEHTPNVTLYGDLAELRLAGKKIGVTHCPEFALDLANTAKYDVVFYGHTHQAKIEKIKNTLLVNPGEIMDRKGPASVGIYDTEKGDIEIRKF